MLDESARRTQALLPCCLLAHPVQHGAEGRPFFAQVRGIVGWPVGVRLGVAPDGAGWAQRKKGVERANGMAREKK